MPNNEWRQAFGPVSNALVNYWSGRLKPAKAMTLLLIAHRTLRWGKQWEFISYNQIINGIPAGSDGIIYHTGIGVSRPRLTVYMQDLELRQLIFVDRSKPYKLSRGYLYSLNIDTIVEPLGLGVDNHD